MTIHPTTIRPALTPAEQRYLDLYAGVADRLPGARHVRVRAWREAALNLFASQGLPHRRVEEWKYTDLRALMPEVHPLAGILPAVAADISLEATIGEALAHLDAYRAVFVDGLFRPDLSTVQDAAGVTFEPLRAGLEEDSGPGHALAHQAEGERDVICRPCLRLRDRWRHPLDLRPKHGSKSPFILSSSRAKASRQSLRPRKAPSWLATARKCRSSKRMWRQGIPRYSRSRGLRLDGMPA